MGVGKTIRVVVKEPGEKPVVKEIDSGLKSMQSTVGGMIEMVGMPGVKDADMILHDEGKLIGLPPNFWIPEYEDLAVGTIIICGVDQSEGETISLTDEQVVKALGYIIDNDFYGPNSGKLYDQILGKNRESKQEHDEPELE